MEINEKIEEGVKIDLKKRTEMLVENNVSLGNFKWYYNTCKDRMSALTVKQFKIMCPKLDITQEVEPTATVKDLLKVIFNLQCAVAISQIQDEKAAVSTENVLSLALMGNQTRRFDIGFTGGAVPTYQLCRLNEGGEDPKQIPIGQIRVVSGVPVFGGAICHEFVEMGFKTIVPVTAAAVNAGVITAVTMQFNSEDRAVPHPFVPPKLGVPGTTRGYLTTSLAALLVDNFRHKPASPYQIVADMSKKSDVLERMFKSYPPGSLGQPIPRVQATPIIGGMSLTDTPRSILMQWNKAGYQQLGKAKQLLRDSDTGFRSMNAPMKWKMPLEVICDFFSEDETIVLALYGAAGGRARRLFENKVKVNAYDLKDSPVPTKKVSDADFEKYKIDRWTVKDVFQHEEFDEHVFVSDIFIDNWKKKELDPQGHKFVSGVLRGQIVNDKVVTCPKLPAVRAVKGFVPELEHVKLYDGCYPFIVFRVCRPMTMELIYISVGTPELRMKMDSVVADLLDRYPRELKDRVSVIANPEQYEAFLKFTVVCVCEELNFQQRKMALDPRIVMSSSHNRSWHLDPEELPCLFVPRHMRSGALNVVDSNSALFGGVVEHERWTEEDFEEIRHLEQEFVNMGAPPAQNGEGRIVPAEVVDFNDD